MISERDIANRFSAIWLESFPLLTPNFMRVFNESHISRFSNNAFVGITGHSDVVSEYAFYLAKRSFEHQVELDTLKRSLEARSDALSKALLSIRLSNKFTDIPDDLSEQQYEEGGLLAKNILSFILSFTPGVVKFTPRVPGYGIVGECWADISVDNILFEIKTVKRSFRSKDLKQLLLYLALASVAGQEDWLFAGLYNPRDGRYTKFGIDSLVGYLSGGRPSKEAFRSLLDSLGRDAIFEQRF